MNPPPHFMKCSSLFSDGNTTVSGIEKFCANHQFKRVCRALKFSPPDEQTFESVGPSQTRILATQIGQRKIPEIEVSCSATAPPSNRPLAQSGRPAVLSFSDLLLSDNRLSLPDLDTKNISNFTHQKNILPGWGK